MKRLVQLLVVTLICSASGQAQYVVFTRANNGTNDITIPSGEIWQIHSWVGFTDSSVRFFRLLEEGSSNAITSFWGSNGEVVAIDKDSYPTPETRYYPVGMLVPGPAVLQYNTDSTQAPLQSHTYSIGFKKLSSLSIQNNVSATSVVIPSSATGDVDVKMEQSADNVTWTECLPGTYNSSTVKRFFRLRAVEK